MKKKRTFLLLIITVSAILLTGCVPGDGSYNISKSAGFFSGIWHGWIAPVSLLVSFFDRNISIYETFNKGWWYDFGYYMAIISGFGGISLFRKKKSEDKNK